MVGRDYYISVYQKTDLYASRLVIYSKLNKLQNVSNLKQLELCRVRLSESGSALTQGHIFNLRSGLPP